jgi:transposase
VAVRHLASHLLGQMMRRLSADWEKVGAAAAGGARDSDDQASERPETPRRKGHGRNGAKGYFGAKHVGVPHPTLHHKDRCPECGRGKLYEQREPAMLVRIRGMAPFQGTVYEQERLRCNLCGEVFTAPPPEGVGEEKYDETVAAMLVLLHYGAGFPFHRLEVLQRALGVPLPAGTQWEEIAAHEGTVGPNSGLGQAMEYLLGHWEGFTLFLRVAGAPLDNNVHCRKDTRS